MHRHRDGTSTGRSEGARSPEPGAVCRKPAIEDRGSLLVCQMTTHGVKDTKTGPRAEKQNMSKNLQEQVSGKGRY